MKQRDVERLRTIGIVMPFILNNFICNKFDCVPLEVVSSIISSLRTVDLLTMGFSEKFTSDYKELKGIYDDIIVRTASFMEYVKFSDPIEVFATYVYLYRHGYLSYNKSFKYDMDLKDFSCMGGLDVVRGKGVCRNLSAYLADVYNELGYNATSINVRVPKLPSLKTQDLSSVDIEASNDAIKIVEILEHLTDIIPLCNHKITKVVKDDKTYVLDSTNDGLLHYDKDTDKLYFTDKDSYMKYGYISSFITKYYEDQKWDLVYGYKDSSITDEEYTEIYLNTLKKCENMPLTFEAFYEWNKQLYNDIYKLSEDQRSLIGRFYPVLPRRRLKK